MRNPATSASMSIARMLPAALASILLSSPALLCFCVVPATACRQDYRWIDPHPVRDAAYWIEDLDINGTRGTHGPAYVESPSAEVAATLASARPRPCSAARRASTVSPPPLILPLLWRFATRSPYPTARPSAAQRCRSSGRQDFGRSGRLVSRLLRSAFCRGSRSQHRLTRAASLRRRSRTAASPDRSR